MFLYTSGLYWILYLKYTWIWQYELLFLVGVWESASNISLDSWLLYYYNVCIDAHLKLASGDESLKQTGWEVYWAWFGKGIWQNNSSGRNVKTQFPSCYCMLLIEIQEFKNCTGTIFSQSTLREKVLNLRLIDYLPMHEQTEPSFIGFAFLSN
jgi:hypothetical protein